MTTQAKPGCEICGDSTGRCRFGNPHGLCSCWRGTPCNVRPVSPWIARALAHELPAKVLAR